MLFLLCAASLFGQLRKCKRRGTRDDSGLRSAERSDTSSTARSLGDPRSTIETSPSSSSIAEASVAALPTGHASGCAPSTQHASARAAAAVSPHDMNMPCLLPRTYGVGQMRKCKRRGTRRRRDLSPGPPSHASLSRFACGRSSTIETSVAFVSIARVRPPAGTLGLAHHMNKACLSPRAVSFGQMRKCERRGTTSASGLGAMQDCDAAAPSMAHAYAAASAIIETSVGAGSIAEAFVAALPIGHAAACAESAEDASAQRPAAVCPDDMNTPCRLPHTYGVGQMRKCDPRGTRKHYMSPAPGPGDCPAIADPHVAMGMDVAVPTGAGFGGERSPAPYPGAAGGPVCRHDMNTPCLLARTSGAAPMRKCQRRGTRSGSSHGSAGRLHASSVARSVAHSRSAIETPVSAGSAAHASTQPVTAACRHDMNMPCRLSETYGVGQMRKCGRPGTKSRPQSHGVPLAQPLGVPSSSACPSPHWHVRPRAQARALPHAGARQ